MAIWGYECLVSTRSIDGVGEGKGHGHIESWIVENNIWHAKQFVLSDTN